MCGSVSWHIYHTSILGDIYALAYYQTGVYIYIYIYIHMYTLGGITCLRLLVEDGLTCCLRCV